MQSSKLLGLLGLLIAVSVLQPTDARQLGSYNGYGHHHHKHDHDHDHDHDHKKRHHRHDHKHDHDHSHYRRRLEDKDDKAKATESSDYNYGNYESIEHLITSASARVVSSHIIRLGAVGKGTLHSRDLPFRNGDVIHRSVVHGVDLHRNISWCNGKASVP